jgi:transcription-repair coupling factor (superfamily II helicase)
VNLKVLAENIAAAPQFKKITEQKRTNIEGLSGGSFPAFCCALALSINEPVLVLSQKAPELSNDINAYLGKDKAVFFPSWDTFPTEDISPSKEIVGERMRVLERITRGEKIVVTAGIRSAITSVIPKDVLLRFSLRLEQGGNNVKRDALAKKLVMIGFKRRDIVGERGEFSIRGGIVDIYSPDQHNPVRIEYSGDIIESIRSFDPATQRSIDGLKDVKVLPVHEIILEDATEYKDGIELNIPKVYPRFASIFDYLGKCAIVMDNPNTLKLACDKFAREIEELRGGASGKFYLDCDELESIVSTHQLIEHAEGAGGISFNYGPAENFLGKLNSLTQWVSQMKIESSIFIVSRQVNRLYEQFIDNGINAQKLEEVPSDLRKGIYLLYGELEQGYVGNGIAVLTDRDIFGSIAPKLKYDPRPTEGISKEMLAELKVGDLVVHSNYGIGIYRGLQVLDIGGALQEYIQIDYAQEDKLYVPLHQMGLVEKYSGGGGHNPKINRLGTSEWARTKSRAKRSIKDMTAELLDLYISRQKQEGFKFQPDSMWQAELERSFPYEETPDQARAIIDIKNEMESGKLVDRLVCGDVGYGKTEVALRAAFKTVLAGKQVALLTPTTILANQHFNTFTERFRPYPIVVDMLSRFKTKDEQKQITRSMEAGAVDIVIGTHRLIQKDIRFKDLGLLIIDEEQKFGVSHKERLKQLAGGVNVITLTATPIPRTLYMALSGVREMSVIATPPLDRSPIRTYLREWNENVIKESILRELERGGQVYFVHNYVKTIHKIASLIKTLVPEASIAVAHGQMKETELENVMIKFINREFNVLVSTSIIESGLDIPSVNTVIIDHAENFGLSQLYQIRGRVGRSSTRAFAYLLYHREKALTGQALERLSAIQEFTALGSGYKLAMADLEIRGAGTVLGAAQHGHMLNIGFDMYCDLLEESVRELKHLEVPDTNKILIDLKIDAFIPKDYVPDDKQRIALYRRMNFLNDPGELDDFHRELTDRFGRVPKELEALFDIIALKIEAGGRDVASILGGSEQVEIRLRDASPIALKTKGMPKEKWFKMVASTIRALPGVR